MPSREETTAASANHLPIKGTRSRNRWFADTLLEGDGFELPVPRAMQARLEAKIAGFGCMSPPIICGCRRWPSAKAQSEISEPNPYRAEPEVRIHLPPESTNHRFLPDLTGSPTVS